MWVTILAVAGAFLALLSRRTSERTLARRARRAGGAGARLLRLPADRLEPVRAAVSRRRSDGQGLNPLLQDPGLAFHPPTLYLGYVGLSVAFSLAVGALLTGEVDARLARAMRPWVLGAWIFLTLGITAGSYWAYYELGWGGYWFWDPVENASLMPWLAATALAPLDQRPRRARSAQGVDDDARGHRFLDVDGRHLPRPLGHPDLGPRFRHRPRARHLPARASRDLCRRGVHSVRDARSDPEGRRAVRAGQPRERARDQQSAS